MDGNGKQRFKGRSANYILLLVSIFISTIVALLILEIVVRIKYPILTLYRYSQTSDYVMEPNRIVKFAKEEFDTEIRTNTYGLRDDEPDPASDLRIVLLGDSFTFGHGVDHRETYGFLLESKLGASFRQDVEIVNAGHNGYDTRRELAYLKDNYDAIDPKAVVVGFVINDVLSNSGEYFFSPIARGALRHIPLRSVQSLGEYLKTPVKLMRKLGIVDNTIDDTAIDHFDCLRATTTCDRGWEATSSYLADLNKFARQHNLPVVLLNIPVLDQIRKNPNIDDYDRTLASTRLSRISSELGFHFVDLIDCQALTEFAYFKKDGHWNGLGHAAAARCIDDRFRKKWITHPYNSRGGAITSWIERLRCGSLHALPHVNKSCPHPGRLLFPIDISSSGQGV